MAGLGTPGPPGTKASEPPMCLPRRLFPSAEGSVDTGKGAPGERREGRKATERAGGRKEGSRARTVIQCRPSPVTDRPEKALKPKTTKRNTQRAKPGSRSRDSKATRHQRGPREGALSPETVLARAP